jgi:hypothetical protein
MKNLWITAIAAAFAFLMLVPISASAEPIVTLQPGIQQVGYYPVYYGRPWACRNPWFRHHHRRLCW